MLRVTREKIVFLVVSTLVLLLVGKSFLGQPSEPHRSTLGHKVLTNIFSNKSLEIDEVTLEQHAPSLELIQNASPIAAAQAALCVAHFIHKKLLEEKEKESSPETLPEDENLFHTFFLHYIMQERIEYLTAIAHTFKQSLSWWQRAHASLNYIVRALSYRLSATQEWEDECLKHPLSKAVIDYIALEDEFVLSDYEKALRFFALKDNTSSYPPLVNFWRDAGVRSQIAARLKRFKPPQAHLQGLAFLEPVASVVASTAEHTMPLFLQTAAMSGGSMYAEWISSQVQEEVAALGQKQRRMSQDFQAFLATLQANRKKLVVSIIQGFSHSQQTLKGYYGAINKEQQEESLYLLRSINLQQPKQKYLIQPIAFDQLFAAAPMITPATTPYQWFNIYQDRVGDWQYDVQSGAFWQRMIVPYGIAYWQKGNANPEANAIFNEYIAPKFPYEIVVELTLANVTYPFFAGIITNKARWISGAPECLTQYRLIGFQGIDKPTPTITLRFAEQKIKKSPAGSKDQSSETILSPLQQIETDTNTLLWTLPDAQVKKLIKQALVFRFTLRLEPQKITYVIEQQQDSTSSSFKQVTSGTIDNLQSFIGIFGGIGFMAPGCQAAFKLIKPSLLNNDKS